MELVFLILAIYLLCHIPAVIMLILGLMRLKSDPDSAKRLLIFAGVYFIVGAGICGAILGG